jgi:hypothetical protein
MSNAPVTQETQALMVNNLNVVANAVALATRVILDSDSSATSDTLGGEPITEDFIANAVAARAQAALAPHMGGV